MSEYQPQHHFFSHILPGRTALCCEMLDYFCTLLTLGANFPVHVICNTETLWALMSLRASQDSSWKWERGAWVLFPWAAIMCWGQSLSPHTLAKKRHTVWIPSWEEGECFCVKILGRGIFKPPVKDIEWGHAKWNCYKRGNISTWFGMATASYSVLMIFSFQKIKPLSKQQTVNHWRSQKRNPQPRVLPRFLLCLPKWIVHPWSKSEGPVCPA